MVAMGYRRRSFSGRQGADESFRQAPWRCHRARGDRCPDVRARRVLGGGQRAGSGDRHPAEQPGRDLHVSDASHDLRGDHAEHLSHREHFEQQRHGDLGDPIDPDAGHKGHDDSGLNHHDHHRGDPMAQGTR
jgi:hypothetical protein